MEYKLIGITGLILIILFLTWLKDGEKMDPSLKKRVIIDTTTIMIFWGVFEFYNYSSDKLYEEEVSVLVNGALIFFFARMIQLIAQINPLFQDFVKFIKKKGIDLDNEDKWQLNTLIMLKCFLLLKFKIALRFYLYTIVTPKFSNIIFHNYKLLFKKHLDVNWDVFLCLK